MKAGIKVFAVNPDIGKASLYAKLRLSRPDTPGDWPDGWVHLPKWADSDEIRQLTAEQQIKERVKGGFFRYSWQILPGRRNEALDCAVYAHACAHVMGLPRWTEAHWTDAEERVGMYEVKPKAAPQVRLSPAPTSAPAPAQEPVVARQSIRRNNWLGGRAGRWL